MTKDIRRSNLDVCRGLSQKKLDHSNLKDTRNTIFKQHPDLLAKLNNVAKACTGAALAMSGNL